MGLPKPCTKKRGLSPVSGPLVPACPLFSDFRLFPVRKKRGLSPFSVLLRLFAGAHFPRTDARISLVTACSQCQARYGLGPRGAPVPLAMTRHGLLPAGGTNPSALPTVLFGGQHLQGRLHPLPLHLACFPAYASTCPLPSTPQGSILGSRLTITQAGLPPARTRGLARPHCPRISARLDTGLAAHGYPGGTLTR
jgi:hypothetical protein